MTGCKLSVRVSSRGEWKRIILRSYIIVVSNDSKVTFSLNSNVGADVSSTSIGSALVGFFLSSFFFSLLSRYRVSCCPMVGTKT